MQLIAVDIGNSSIKAAAIEWPMDATACNQDFRIQVVNSPNEWTLNDTPARWSVCSVHRDRSQQLREWIEQHRPHDSVLVISANDVPIDSNVESRAHVGRDRLTAAYAATVDARSHHSPGPLIVVDAGTAVTVDYVSENHVFQGGQIFPGAGTMLRFLSESTDALPDLTGDEFVRLLGDLEHDFVGKSTSEAIIRGVFQTQLASILRAVKGMNTGGNAQVFATGRGIQAIRPGLPRDWCFDRHLVLRGCMRIGYSAFTNRSNVR